MHSLHSVARKAKVSLLAGLALVVGTAHAAPTTLYTDMHDFGGKVTLSNAASGFDGFSPSNITFDSLGNMYGTTAYGGQYGVSSESYSSGVFWEITTAGVYIDIHDFGGTAADPYGNTVRDGFTPSSTVTFDKKGNIYGTTEDGGEFGLGTVWEYTPKTTTTPAVYSVLHSFGATITNANGKSGPDGIYPEGGVTVDSAGDLFGTTSEGGPNGPSYEDGEGILWEIAAPTSTAVPVGVYSDLHDFGGTITVNTLSQNDGSYPLAGVTLDSAGNLYGTASSGGAIQDANGEGGDGMVWEYAVSTATYTDLHDFGATITNADGTSGLDGAGPVAPVVFDASGNMYGTTQGGGPNTNIYGGTGMIWEITKASVYKDIHDFGALKITNADGTMGPDGIGPITGITIDPTGNLFGTTAYGGPNKTKNEVDGSGMLFEITTANKYLDLHDFGGTLTSDLGVASPDGTNPQSVIIDPNGNLLGSAINGGANNASDGGYGMIWSVSTGLTGISLNPTSVIGGSPSTATVTIGAAAPVGGSVINLTSSSPSATVPATVTVPAGQTTATFTVTTTAVTANAQAVITALQTGFSFQATLTITTPGGSVALSQSSVLGGLSTSAQVLLTGPAPKGGLKVLLSTNSPYASVPASITIPAGSHAGSFTVTTSPVNGTPDPIAIMETIKGTTKAVLTVLPASLHTITLSQTSVVGKTQAPITGTIKFTGLAPAAGRKVTLTSSNPAAASVQASVTVVNGQATATFTVTPHSVTTTQKVVITASYGSTAISANLTVSP
jgi:hypothetical protein